MRKIYQGVVFIKLHAEVVDFFRAHGDVLFIDELEIFQINNLQYIPTSQKGLYMVVNELVKNED